LDGFGEPGGDAGADADAGVEAAALDAFGSLALAAVFWVRRDEVAMARSCSGVLTRRQDSGIARPPDTPDAPDTPDIREIHGLREE
jgi:hypothetical protein